MLYRQFPRSGKKVSAVSLGAEYLLQVDQKTCHDVVSAAIDHGMNYMDLFMSEAFVRDWIGEALRGRRDKMMVAGHLGCTQKDGQYYRTREPKICREYFDDLLTRLHTDYIDVLMLHYIDTMEDADACLDENGFLGLAREYLVSGKARMLGFSGHVPAVASRLIATGMFDLMMFSVSPALDLMPPESTIDDLFGESMEKVAAAPSDIDPSRTALYRQCEKEKTGIVVMKGYSAGNLFKRPDVTPDMCIHYALTRPGVVTMAPGCRSIKEIEAAVHYCEASEQERDFTPLITGAQWNSKGVCMYCNHCLPCGQNIDVAKVTKLLDRYEEGDKGAAKEYKALPHNGGDCTACGECASRCPFGVDSVGNMARAEQLMG